jgi:predicted nuclease of predicted toxin-antitoxin system
MRLVADECVDFGIIRELRIHGVEVFSICEEAGSIQDTDVLSIANEQNIILLTEDKDFGELVFRLKLPNHGVVLVRMIKSTRQEKIEKVVEIILQHYKQLENAFSLITDEKVKIRKY